MNDSLNLGTLRPESLDDLFRTGDIAAIQNTLDENNLPRVMGFFGTTGCGKTTSARLISCRLLGLNEEESRHLVSYGEVPGHYYREINVSTKNKVDDAREYEEDIKRSAEAIGGGVHIFVFDEAHRLTKDAQNVMLQILEAAGTGKYPAYIFVLSTEPQSFIPAFSNRLIKYNFSTLDPRQGYELMDHICKRVKKPLLQADVKKDIFNSSYGIPREILNNLQTYWSTGTLPSSTEEVNASATQLMVWVKEISGQMVKDRDVMFGVRDPKQLLQDIKNYQIKCNNSWEHARIRFLAYIAYVMKNTKNLRALDMILFGRYFDIMKPPIIIEGGVNGEVDFFSRITRMIETRAEALISVEEDHVKKDKK